MQATLRWTMAGLCLVATTGIVACGDKKTTPTSPTAAVSGGAASTGGVSGPSDLVGSANPDGSTLKASAPGNPLPSGGAPVDTRQPTLTWTNATGRYQQASFTYELEFYKVNDIQFRVTVPQASGATTSYDLPAELDYDTVYRWRVRATLGTAFGPWAATATFLTPPRPIRPPTTGGGGGIGPRTPDPAPGSRLPLPNMAAVVEQVARQYPNELRHSCQHEGGSWDFMDLVVDTLRANYDTRWGYNCKRGNCYDPSLDVIAYHFGAGPDEGSKDVYVVDIMLSHCGSNPTPAWIDQTQVTWNSGTTGAFTSRGRFGEGQLATGGGPVTTLPPVTGPGGPVNGRTPDPPAGSRLPLPSYAQAKVFELAAARPDLLKGQSCPRGLKYVNNPWQDYIVDELRKIDTRWGYNAKPNRSAADNGGVAVVAAGDEITYHWGPGKDQGSTDVYAIDILQGHCGSNPAITWRDFTGQEPVIWTGAGRF